MDIIDVRTFQTNKQLKDDFTSQKVVIPPGLKKNPFGNAENGLRGLERGPTQGY